MTNFFNELIRFKDQVFYFFQHPESIKTALMNDHQLLVEVIGILLILCLLLLALFKPAPAVKAEKKSPPPIRKKTASTPSVTAKGRKPEVATPPSSENPKSWIKRAPPSIHELSLEEEQALNQAIAIAGKQALAEVTGAPRQTEFFENNEVSDVAKKMFARQKKETLNLDATVHNSTPPNASKLEFIILYFMAPRSDFFQIDHLFQILRENGLELNDQHVFEYKEASRSQFYVISALKPGHFDVHSLQASVPGISFVLDLKNVQEGKSAFNTMLGLIHQISQSLKGDILDEQRQRLTQNSMHTYMTRIKAFTHLEQNKKK